MAKSPDVAKCPNRPLKKLKLVDNRTGKRIELAIGDWMHPATSDWTDSASGDETGDRRSGN